ncbi:MAG: EamA family transporter [Tagaea sp.]
MSILVVLCLIWGFNQVAIKIGNEGISPAWQAALRSAGAAALVLVWARVRGIPLFARDGTLAAGVAAGARFAAEIARGYWAVEFTTAARAVVLLYTAPFTVAIGAQFFLPGDRLTRPKLLGLGACFAGVAPQKIAASSAIASPISARLSGSVSESANNSATPAKQAPSPNILGRVSRSPGRKKCAPTATVNGAV